MKHTFKRKTMALASAGALLTGIATIGSVVPAQAANAPATSCSGQLIDSDAITSGGQKIGELDLYYSSRTGINCAMTQHLGSTRGKALDTYVEIATYKGSWTNPSGWINGPIDKGHYAYFAGAVSISGKNRCVSVLGGIANSTGKTWHFGSIHGHCG